MDATATPAAGALDAPAPAVAPGRALPGPSAPQPGHVARPTAPDAGAAAQRRLIRRGRLAIGGLLASGVLVTLSAAHTQSFLPLSIRPVLSSMAGLFGGVSLNLHVAGAIAVLVLMFCSYAVAVSVSEHLAPGLVLGAIVALLVIVALGPPLISTDVFSYQAYARMGSIYHINPYLYGPVAIQPDMVFPYVGSKWVQTPSAYGPLFTVASFALAKLSIAASVYVYKLIAGAAALALVAVVWRCAAVLRTSPTRAVALVGLNPLLVVYGVGGGHNDLLMLLAVTGSLYALICRRDRLGGALGAVAVGIKLTGGLMLPFAIASQGARGARRRRQLAIGLGIGIAAVAAVSFGAFGTGGFHLLGTLSQGQKEGGWNSVPGFIDSRLGLATVSRITTYLLAAGFAAICGWLLAQVWRDRIDWIAAAGWATLAVLIASSSLLPWYVAWMLPLAALGRDRRLWWSSVAMTGIVLGVQLLGLVPHGTGLF